MFLFVAAHSTPPAAACSIPGVGHVWLCCRVPVLVTGRSQLACGNRGPTQADEKIGSARGCQLRGWVPPIVVILFDIGRGRLCATYSPNMLRLLTVIAMLSHLLPSEKGR
jgi:hypothetical protein